MLTTGPHRVETKSIHEADFEALLDGETADICYTNPPWNERMMSYFATMREKQAGQSATNITHEQMLRELRNTIADHVDGLVIVSASLDDDTTETFLDPVLYNQTTQITRYRGSQDLRKNKMIFGGTAPEYDWDHDMSMQYGLSLCKNTIAHAASDVPADIPVVLDPLCGSGSAAVASLEAGCRFVGNEFNIKLANDCVDKINTVRARMDN